MIVRSHSRRSRFVSQVFALMLAASLVSAPGAQAGDHWLSRVTVRRPNRPAISMWSNLAVTQGPVKANASGSTVIFDVTVSLDTNPLGDDDYPVDGGTTDVAQKEYEKRLEQFAKAVYQSSNGALRIGKVTIFRSKPGEKRVDSADVLWDDNCAANSGPRATPSGLGKTGKIWFCTNWPGAASMATPKGSGYTLAHEWGHFTYGLYDEYAHEQCTQPSCQPSVPRGTDTAAAPSIMMNQWLAVSGNTDYLEFSTQNIHPYRADSTGTNAQKRMFGESGWQTLTRDVSTDPKSRGLPPRTQFVSLTAPSAPNWIVHDSESSALDDFDIRWAGNLVNELSIDTSGSMAGSPLSNAKNGANLLIDAIQSPSALGLSSFNTDVLRNFAITDIPDPDTGVRAGAKAAVSGLSSTGVTSLYDALMASLSGVQSFSSNRPSVVYVLTDGADNDSTATESDVIAAYQAAQVPIVAFAYGMFAPTGTLFKMARDTGGAFYQSPTTLAEIQTALIAAEAKFSSNVLVASSKVSAGENTTTTRTIALDGTLASARINLAYSGNASDFEFRLLLPNGTASGAIFTCEGNVSCTAILDDAFLSTAGHGDYQIQMINKTALQKDVTVLISATPSSAETYALAVGFETKNVTYPADMALVASVTKGPAIAGLDVVATITTPSGSTFDLTLLDDGKGADLIADDGSYSASIPYRADGIYSASVTASNAAGTASTTYVGISVSLREDGSAVIPISTPVTEHFTRVESAAASVTGFQSDDHSGGPASGPCTAIFDNNADTPGRIDAAGDADCFKFVPSSLDRPIVVRVTSLTSGMDPLLTVYDHTGNIQIAQVNLTTTEAPDSGAVVTIPAARLDAAGMVLVVKHLSPSATVGGYAVSAGAKIPSDGGPAAAPAEPIPTLGDSAIWLLSALLGGLGLWMLSRRDLA